jgi:hypothetical protein|tara:strand:+ start:36 stop:548 length:513 start_codon:yes stop_codon:yes gene_type:complete
MAEIPEDISVIVGVDNGLKGGLVALSRSHGLVIDTKIMPVTEVAGRKEVDNKQIWEWARQFDNLVVAIEAAPHHCPSAGALRSLALNFGKMEGFFEAKGVSVFRVTVHAWQKKMLAKKEKGLTKLLALDKANEHWPEENWLPTKKHKKPHDGLIDAALIAEHVRLGGDTQ